MITKNGKKRHSYQMDYIADKDLYRAVMFARKMISEGTAIGLAIYRAATYYGYDSSEVAKYIGQRGGRRAAQTRTRTCT